MAERRQAVAVWAVVSILLHTLPLLLWQGVPELPSEPLFTLPNAVEFGVIAAGGDEGASSAKPAEREPQPVLKPRPAKVPAKAPARAKPIETPDPNAIAAARDVSAEAKPEAEDGESGEAAATSGIGVFGSGTGGEGAGSGAGVSGATIALNVDLERVRGSAILLETRALLDIIPEWQALLSGSGLDAVRDFRRVFVAAPSLDRASLIVSAEHSLSRSRLTSAVQSLAAERGTPSTFRDEAGIPVAAWRNRGPTERVIALTENDQLLITRSNELGRVLAVSRSLGAMRKKQGFAPTEVDARGGLLAMHDDEAVALWVEGVPKYVRHATFGGVPDALRLSIYRADQFYVDLVVRGSYASKSAAEDALLVMDHLRQELTKHPRVIYLGLTSALERARIEADGAGLQLKVRLTLHQTRYLLKFVSQILRPRPQP